jgi:hypothetical protein
MYTGHNIVLAIDKKCEHPNQSILLAIDKNDKMTKALKHRQSSWIMHALHSFSTPI